MKVPMIEVIKEENQNHELHLLELSTVLMNQRCPGRLEDPRTNSVHNI